MTLRYEGVRFSDGSVAVRRLASDPCDRASLTFETMRELEEDVGAADVTWIADRGSSKPPASRSRPPVPGEIDAYFAREHALAESAPTSLRAAIRAVDEFAIPIGPVYAGDGLPAVRAAELDRYAPEPEDVESI